MLQLGIILRNLRTEKQVPLRVVAAFLEIDAAVLSKMERGIIIPSKIQVLKFAEYFSVEPSLLLRDWLSDKVYNEIKDEDLGLEALKVCEERMRYGKL
jgi:HTH-type transcriptional regulator, competence development regulator